MRKLLSILFLTAFSGVAAMAQDGNMQLSVILGNNPMFKQSGTYLLPNYNSDQTGLNDEPAYYFNLNEVGSNNIANMVGVQLAFFLGDALDVNAMFSMNISSTPKKDYIEGFDLDEFSTPDSKYIEGSLTNNWYANVGCNAHLLHTKKVSAYSGLRLGMQNGSIQTAIPYTGDDEEFYYHKAKRAGKITTFQTAIVAGAQTVTDCGIVFGVEFYPFAYQYSAMQIDPSGAYNYVCNNHSVKIFSTPTLKLGLRF